MTEEHRTHYRLALLMQLHAAMPYTLKLPALLTGQKLAGFPHTTLPELMTEAAALVELGQARTSGNPVNAAELNHGLTEAGRVVLSQAGLL